MTAVVWQTYGENSISRGYWDQGIIEALFDHSLWRPINATTFAHCEGFKELPADAEGAIVVVPARHNAEHVARLNVDIARLNWLLLILTGDEESVFPLQAVQHDDMRVWWMSGRPDRHVVEPHRVLGSGWPPQARDYLPRYRDFAMQRPLDWFFAGQVTHNRRTACVNGIERLITPGRLVKTESFTSGLPHAEYYEAMASAKIAFCPSGAASPDSFRVYEALEAGCLPIVDNLAPSGRVPGYWSRVLEGVNLTLIEDWARLPSLVPDYAQQHPRPANRVFAQWQNWRRELAYSLEDDLVKLGHVLRESTRLDVEDLITVIVVSSPIPSHPETTIIDETIESIRTQLPTADMLVLIDGVRDEQAHRRNDYEEYTQRLLWDCLYRWHQTCPVLFDSHTHQASMLREALRRVRTPLVLFVEHDTPIYGEIEWSGIADAVMTHEADLVRLHHESQILAPHEHLMLDRETQHVGLFETPMMRTVQWSQRPHVASVNFYNRVLNDHFRPDARTMIEDVMHGVVSSAWLDHGMDGWERYKLWIYAPEGDMKRSWHTDGRAGEDKYGMFFGVET